MLIIKQKTLFQFILLRDNPNITSYLFMLVDSLTQFVLMFNLVDTAISPPLINLQIIISNENLSEFFY